MKKVSEFKNERELQEDLAEYLRNMGLLTFTEIQIPGMYSSRADIIAMTPHRYSTKDIRVYEVKFNRGTWLSDKKYQKYLDCCNRMYIACQKGLIKKDELPDEIGLITRNDNGWNVAKSPKLNINPKSMNVDFILSLLYRGYEENKIQRDLRDRIIADSNVSLTKQAEKIGYEISCRINKSAETYVEKWCEKLWEVFEKYGFKIPQDIIKQDKFNGTTVNLPDLYQIQELLGSVNGLIKDAAAIKAIGQYLENIYIPEDDKSNIWGSRKENRENALKLINS